MLTLVVCEYVRSLICILYSTRKSVMKIEVNKCAWNDYFLSSIPYEISTNQGVTNHPATHPSHNHSVSTSRTLSLVVHIVHNMVFITESLSNSILGRVILANSKISWDTSKWKCSNISMVWRIPLRSVPEYKLSTRGFLFKHHDLRSDMHYGAD